MSSTLSLRIEDAAHRALADRSARSGQTKSRLAARYIEEGLRTDAHPGIVFRSGPAGRRAAIVGGPDVWEVTRVFRELDLPAGEATPRLVKLLRLDPTQVTAALDYYAAYKDEIDRWIQLVDNEGERLEAEWRRKREVLG